MSITKEYKKEVISKFSINEKDTGSAEVQIAIFSERIKNLTEHLKKHKKDNHTKKGLIVMVEKRKKLLNFLLQVFTFTRAPPYPPKCLPHVEA